MTPSLAELQSLYDQNRFLEAYRLTDSYWRLAWKPEDLSTEKLVYGGRLAFRLGGMRLSRRLFRAALLRDPENPQVRYFSLGVRWRGMRLFEELRRWEKNSELEGADPGTQASWLATQAVTWSSLRDFERAHACLRRAKQLDTERSWVFSCEADVLGREGRREEALAAAETCWEMNRGTPYGARSLGECLMNLRRVAEGARRLSLAAEGCQSFEMANIACWHVCAQAEAADGEERKQLLARAEELAWQTADLAPLADREARVWFARGRLDIAQLRDDHPGMERWAKEARSPFHRKLLENLRKKPEGLRIRLPFRRAVQKHDECLPTAVSSALSAMGSSVDAEAMAAELTFGGTPEWAAAEWLEKRGFATRFFVVTPEVAERLIRNGFAFVMTLESEASSHAVAAVGLDEAAGTLLIHDPNAIRTTEYLLESFGKGEAPLGPRGMAIVSQQRSSALDELLPAEDVQVMTGRASHQRALAVGGPGAGRKVVRDLRERWPEHPATRLLQAIQAVEDGRVGTALGEYQSLANRFPNSAFVRARLLECCRALGDTALMRRTLAGVLERGTLPGIESQQIWRYPPGVYASEYADLLCASAETRKQARKLLDGVIEREAALAPAWHILGDLLWEEKDAEGAVLGYRIAALLAASQEHYARAYCDALGKAGRLEEGLRWLEERARRFAGPSLAVATWVTWVDALEDWGYPQRALAACEEGLQVRGESAELLSYAVPFLARMGLWEEAERLLEKLKMAGNAELFHAAATDFFRRKGDLAKALQHAQAWVKESPVAMNARGALLNLIAKRDGAEAAAELAGQWFREHPGHDHFEQLYSQYLDQSLAPVWKRYALLRRRVKRNPEDGWAWRQIAFTCVPEYGSADRQGKERLKRRMAGLIGECERTGPQEAATMRLRAQWCEAQGQWAQAIPYWTQSIEQDPHNFFGYRHLWNCLARSGAEERRALWQRLADQMLTEPGRLTAARDTILLVAQRFGVAEAEEAASHWRQLRPNDPEAMEAHADLLLEHGQGRSDAQKALEILQPATERFPYHEGLRFSLADAQRRLGQFDRADEILAEIVRRHPDNSAAQMQLAQVRARHGRLEEALKVLSLSFLSDPQNLQIPEAQARILIEAQRVKEARALLEETTARFPKSVTWRERAIQLYFDSGDGEGAVRLARDGIKVYPRGAYLWFLLGRTLSGARHFAAQGEVEGSLRRSLELNEGLSDAADWLAMLLVEQRQYDEAEAVMKRMRDRNIDPTPAHGRLAWIRRQKGDKPGALEEMAAVVRDAPWFWWGWSVLLDWLEEDQAWDETKRLLGAVPPELKTNTKFRQRRLMLLQRAGLPSADLDSEWDRLLQDFPEEAPLHLLRYDLLRDSERKEQAAQVLERIRQQEPDNPFLLARWTEVLANDAKRKQECVDALLRVMFREREQSAWPAEFAWQAARGAGLEEAAYRKACERLKKGDRPTVSALAVMAAAPMQLYGTKKVALQPLWRDWRPDRGAREVIELQKLVDGAPWPKEGYRSRLTKQLGDFGYVRRVVRYWKENLATVGSDTGVWQETARALTVLARNSEVRKLLKNWRERPGVEMWAVANYVNSLPVSRKSQLEFLRATCRDALAGLQHDHCAKYLAHRLMEASALLNDEEGVLHAWQDHRSYFTGRLQQGEWFSTRRKHLLADLLVMGRALEQNDRKNYREIARSLQWKRIFAPLKFGSGSGDAGVNTVNFRWWWILIWLLYLLVRALTQQP